MLRVLSAFWRDAEHVLLQMPPGRQADRFLDELDAAVLRVAADPSSLPWFPQASSSDTRFKRVGRFPYLVLFSTADPAETVVFALIHDATGPRRIAAAERRV